MDIYIKEYQKKGNQKMSPQKNLPISRGAFGSANINTEQGVDHAFGHGLITSTHEYSLTHTHTHVHMYAHPYAYPYARVYIPICKWIWNASIQSSDSHVPT